MSIMDGRLMMRNLSPLLISLCFLWTTSVSASEQVIFGVGPEALNRTGTEYQIFTGPTIDPTSTESHAETYIASSGVIDNLRAAVDDDPGGSGNWVITFRLAGAGTAQSCTISAGATSCTDLADPVTVTAGQLASIEVNPGGGTDPVATKLHWSFTFTPDIANEHIYGVSTGNNTLIAGTNTMPINGGVAKTSATLARSNRRNGNGTFSDMYARIDSAPGAGNSIIVTMSQSGQSLTCTISGASDTTCSDTSNSITMHGTNRIINVAPTATGSPADKRYNVGVKFTSTGSFDQHVLSMIADDAPSDTNTEYIALTSGKMNFTTDETAQQSLGQAETGLSLMSVFGGAAGSGNTMTVTLRINGSDTALSCSYSGPLSATCTDTGDVDISDGDRIAYSWVPTSTPGVSESAIAMLVNDPAEGERRIW